jgi:hypothetical protein
MTFTNPQEMAKRREIRKGKGKEEEEDNTSFQPHQADYNLEIRKGKREEEEEITSSSHIRLIRRLINN